ncbi:MAG: flippase [Acidiferrobacteraceae bacterium]
MSIRRHSLYNLAGSAGVAVATLTAIPLYLHLIGDSRYGILTIVWVLLGYFSVFDLGLSRATSNRIAQLHDAPASDREQIFWTALWLNIFLGMLGGVLLYFSGAFLLGHVRMRAGLRAEVLSTLPWLSAAVPLTTLSAVLVSAMEGRQWFGLVNVISVFSAILFQAVPLVVAYLHGPDLQWVIPAAVLARAVFVPLLLLAALSAVPLRGAGGFSVARARQLLGYGGWVSVTSLIAMLLETIDRVLIGAILGAAVVAYYTVPFELASRLRMLPGAISRSLFPRLSMQPQGKRSIPEDAVGVVAAMMTPLVALGILAMRPVLGVWVGAAFAVHAAIVGEVVLAGVWINSMAYIPYVQLQAQGRPDIVSKLHLAMLPFYLGTLWVFLHWWGLAGAAMAWSLRVWIDSNVLFFLTGSWSRYWRALWPAGLAIGLSLAGALTLPAYRAAGVGLALIAVATAAIWSWTSLPRLRSTIADGGDSLVTLRPRAK